MLITSFAAGELSDNLKGRIDLQHYYQGCSRLENFDVLPTGGIMRRAGFERLGSLSGDCRLIPFILDKDTSFIFEFVPGKIYVWKNGAKMTGEDGGQITIETKYTSLYECREIQYAQNYDTMIFVQRDHPPLMVKYDFATQTFEYGDMAFNFYPDVTVDDDYGYVLIADEELPVAGLDGQFCLFNGLLWQFDADTQTWILSTGETEPDTGLFTEEDKYPGCVAFYNNRLWFASTNRAKQKVWASRTPDTEDTRYNDFSTYNRYITVNKVVKEADLHLFSADILTGNISEEDGTTLLVNVSQDLTGSLLKKETQYYCSGDYIPVGAKVLTITNDTILIDKAASISEDLKSQVMSIQLWKDATTPSADDYEYQTADNSITTSDCSFFFEIASDQNDAVKWLAANKQMVIGTESSLWYIPSSVTALSIYAELNGRYGSDDIQGFPVDTAVIFFSQGKKAIREYYYNSQMEAFQTNNIALLAEHLLRESAAVDFDFMTNPYNRLLITKENGKLAVLLYDKNNGIMAWSRLTHGQLLVTSVAVTRGEDEADYIYCSVRDGDSYYLERIDETKKVYMDSWKLYTGEENGEYGDSAVLYNATTGLDCPASDIQEDFINEGDVVYIGYLFESVMESMPVVNGNPDSKKRITHLLVRFNDSFMPVMKCGDQPDEIFSDVEEPFSGVKKIVFPGTSDRDVYFSLSVDRPERCSILTVNADLA